MKLKDTDLEIFDGFHLVSLRKNSFTESVGGYDYGFMKWEFDDCQYVYYHKDHNYFIKIRYKEGKNFIFKITFYAEKNADYNKKLKEVQRMLASLKSQYTQINNWGKLKKRKINWTNKRKFEHLLKRMPTSLSESESLQRRIEDFFSAKTHLKANVKLKTTGKPNAKAVLVQLLAQRGLDAPESAMQENTYSELSMDENGVPTIGCEVILYDAIRVRLQAKHKYEWEYVFIE